MGASPRGSMENKRATWLEKVKVVEKIDQWQVVLPGGHVWMH